MVNVGLYGIQGVSGYNDSERAVSGWWTAVEASPITSALLTNEAQPGPDGQGAPFGPPGVDRLGGAVDRGG